MLKMESYCKVAIFNNVDPRFLSAPCTSTDSERLCSAASHVIDTRGTDFHARKQRSYFSLRRTCHCSLRSRLSRIMSRMIIHLLWVHPLFALFCCRSSEYAILSTVSYRQCKKGGSKMAKYKYLYFTYLL